MMSTSSNPDLRPIILHAAATLFREHGYAATSLRDIAATVGIKAGSIYYHFPSKELIAVEVLKEGIRVVSEAVDHALQALPAAAGPLARLEVAMSTHLSALLEKSVFTSAHIRLFSYVPPEVRAQVQIVRTSYDSRWRELVDGVAKSGLLRDAVDASAFRLAILGALNWSLEWYQRGGVSASTIAARWFDLFTRGAIRPSKALPASARGRDKASGKSRRAAARVVGTIQKVKKRGIR
jgi:TetR/AcrR family transcriptional regulator, cholesterol catabolism regulator